MKIEQIYEQLKTLDGVLLLCVVYGCVCVEDIQRVEEGARMPLIDHPKTARKIHSIRGHRNSLGTSA